MPPTTLNSEEPVKSVPTPYQSSLFAEQDFPNPQPCDYPHNCFMGQLLWYMSTRLPAS